MQNEMPLLISFSGGRTSALMSAILQDYHADRPKAFVFANTGKEREETLEFVNECDRRWGLGVVWVEAVVDPELGKGTKHKIVSFDTAAREGEPFESVIQKYGIPSRAFPNCSRELKIRPIHSYVKSLGWTKYETAIGIRSDEAHRVNKNEPTYVYPLIDFGIDKQIVNEWWGRQSFTLNLLEHQGNCDFCWKKSDKKLVQLISENPDKFEWWERMENQYQAAGNRKLATGRNYFFRANRSGAEIRALANQQRETLSEVEYDCFCKST